ncbi:hypothetical protein ACJX0J_009946, partial [Zea mays]
CDRVSEMSHNEENIKDACFLYRHKRNSPSLVELMDNSVLVIKLLECNMGIQATYPTTVHEIKNMPHNYQDAGSKESLENNPDCTTVYVGNLGHERAGEG